MVVSAAQHPGSFTHSLPTDPHAHQPLAFVAATHPDKHAVQGAGGSAPIWTAPSMAHVGHAALK